VIRSLLLLLKPAGPRERRRLVFFLLCSLAAMVIGFVAVPVVQAERLIIVGGYYYIFGVFAAFVWFACRVARARNDVWRAWLRRPGWAGVAIALAAGCSIWIDPFKHKILFDEYVLQATAYHMHATKEVSAVIRAYDIAGTWLSIDTFLDKRPYFFTFLVSLVHDLTGYRVANMFAVNVTLAPIFFALVYWLGVALTGRRGPAFLAMALLATMPLLGQQVSGAGMEMHNLTMLALVMTLAVLYLRAPDDDRLSLLVLGAVLLSQSRYESVIFVVPTALVILAGWIRVERVLLPWAAVVAPLLLIPYAWHNRVLSAKPLLWQLRAGETARFSTHYLAGNLEGAWRFFFNTTIQLANSWWLSVLGAAASLWLLFVALKWLRHTGRRALSSAEFVVFFFGLGIAGNLAMLMFYYWSRLDEIIASRFALPLCFLLALFCARFVRDLDLRRIPATRFAAIGLGLWMLVCGFPAIATRPYTDQNLVMREVEWARDVVKARPGQVLLVTNSSTIPFVLMRIPAIIIGAARVRAEQINYHLAQGTFREVLVMQAIRPTTPEGDTGVEPDDVLPENYQLQFVAEKRFGGRWLRISRLTAILPAVTAAKTATANQAATSTVGNSGSLPRGL
jgi:hypothetical protein